MGWERLEEVALQLAFAQEQGHASLRVTANVLPRQGDNGLNQPRIQNALLGASLEERERDRRLIFVDVQQNVVV